MADERAPEEVDLELERQRPATSVRQASFTETIGAPECELPMLIVALEHLPIGVPPDDPSVEPGEEIEHLDRPRPGDAVADDYDGVDVLAFDVREDGFERREVAVDVSERGNAHGARLDD